MLKINALFCTVLQKNNPLYLPYYVWYKANPYFSRYLDLFYTKIIQYILRSQKSSYNFEIVCYIVLLLYCSSIRYLIRHIKRINFRLMLFDTFWSDDRALMNYRSLEITKITHKIQYYLNHGRQ